MPRCVGPTCNVPKRVLLGTASPLGQGSQLKPITCPKSLEPVRQTRRIKERSGDVPSDGARSNPPEPSGASGNAPDAARFPPEPRAGQGPRQGTRLTPHVPTRRNQGVWDRESVSVGNPAQAANPAPVRLYQVTYNRGDADAPTDLSKYHLLLGSG